MDQPAHPPDDTALRSPPAPEPPSEAQERSTLLSADAARAAGLSFLQPPARPGLLGHLGPYEVLRVIDRGGLSIMLAAFDPALQTRVAIKVLAAEVGTSGVSPQRWPRGATARDDG